MSMDYRLYALRVFTRDWDRAVAFYSETLGMPIHYANPEIGWAELDTGAAHLAIERLAADDLEADELVGRFVGVSLEVDDIEMAHETLAARGVEFLEPPMEQPWGGVLAHFRDPDGNVLTLLGLIPSQSRRSEDPR